MAKATNTPAANTASVPVAAAAAPRPEIKAIPARVGLQIGQRMRYFDTAEEAYAALDEFNAKANKPKGASRTVLTPEQKAERAARRLILMAYAAKQGLEGKKQAMLANTLEDLCDNLPTLLTAISAYNAVEHEEAGKKPEASESTSGAEEVAEVAPEVQESAEETPATESTDPLADFV